MEEVVSVSKNEMWGIVWNAFWQSLRGKRHSKFTKYQKNAFVFRFHFISVFVSCWFVNVFRVFVDLTWRLSGGRFVRSCLFGNPNDQLQMIKNNDWHSMKNMKPPCWFRFRGKQIEILLIFLEISIGDSAVHFFVRSQKWFPHNGSLLDRFPNYPSMVAFWAGFQKWFPLNSSLRACPRAPWASHGAPLDPNSQIFFPWSGGAGHNITRPHAGNTVNKA